MSKTTRATQALKQQGVAFTVHLYAYDPAAVRIGLQAAEALGEPARRVLKTLMTLVDDKPVCVVLPSGAEISMKKLAVLAGGKSAQMMKPADAERFTGYKIGGVSPYGQRKAAMTVFEETALLEPYVYINGGGRGVQVRLDPAEALAAANGIAGAIIA